MSYIHEPGLIYSGLCPFTETDHSEPKIDDYGLDSMTRTYVGANAMLNDFLATWNSASGSPLLVGLGSGCHRSHPHSARSQRW